MPTVELKQDLPDRLAREVDVAGPLSAPAMRALLPETLRRRAAAALLAAGPRVQAAGLRPLSMKDIDAEVKGVRRDRLARSASRR